MFHTHIHLYIVKASIQRVLNSIALIYDTLSIVQSFIQTIQITECFVTTNCLKKAAGHLMRWIKVRVLNPAKTSLSQ